MDRLHVRPCRDAADFDAMQRILVARRAVSRHSGTIHLGDLNWWRAFLLRDYTWDAVAFLWETPSGEPVGWSLITPHYGAFDLAVLPAVEDSPPFDTLLDWTIEQCATSAIVYLEHDNHPAQALYASVGFRPVNTILGHTTSLA